MRTRLLVIVTAVLSLLSFSAAASAHTLTPASPFDFGSVPVFASVDQQFTFTASEEVTVTVSSGAASEDFTLVSNGCDGVELAESETCAFTVRFAPRSLGLLQHEFPIQAGQGGPVRLEVLGTGVVPEPDGATVGISPSFWNFGSVHVGQESSHTFTLTNKTSQPVAFTYLLMGDPPADRSHFQVRNDTCPFTLPGNASCQLEVVFKPTSTGLKHVYLLVEIGAQVEATAQLSGNALPPLPAVSIDPDGYDYGNVAVGAAPVQTTFTVTNSGPDGSVLGVGQVALTGTDTGSFTIVADGCTGQQLGSGEGCDVQISFRPGSAGEKSATLQVHSNASGSPATAELTGTGFRYLSVTPESQDYGEVVLEGSAIATFAVENTGDGLTVQIGQLSLTGASDFTILGDECSNTSLLEGERCLVDVAFTPSSTGQKEASLEIPLSSPALPGAVAQLSGTGVDPAPAVAIDPEMHDFGDLAVGETDTQVFTVTNDGDPGSVLEIGQVGLTGADLDQFRIAADGCSDQKLGYGEQCQVEVDFKPSSAGEKEASLEIPTNASVVPASAALSGTGVVPPAGNLVASPALLSLAGQTGSVVVGVVTVTNAGDPGSTVTVDEARLSGDRFAILADGCAGASLGAGGRCAVTVAFFAAPGESFGVLEVVSREQALQIPLHGSGVAPEPPAPSAPPAPPVPSGPSTTPISGPLTASWAIPGAAVAVTINRGALRDVEIPYTVSGPATIRIVVTDRRGRLVLTAVTSTLEGGTYTFTLTKAAQKLLVPGRYRLTLTASGESGTVTSTVTLRLKATKRTRAAAAAKRPRGQSRVLDL